METKSKTYITKLLKAWEHNYRKGQLSLWILLIISKKPSYSEEIYDKLSKMFANNPPQKFSIYRVLQKLYAIEMLDCVEKKSSSGPKRKYYSLTDLGKEVLKRFIEENLLHLYEEEYETMIKNVLR